MTELIQALTRAANAVAVYYEKQAGTEVPAAAAPSLAADVPASRRTRKPKEEKVPEAAAPAAAPLPAGLDAPAPAAAPAPQAPAPTATAELTEGQSLDALYKICAKVVERFKNSTPTGFDRATNHMKQTYKVAKLADLPHTQRLQFIAWLTAELEKAA